MNRNWNHLSHVKPKYVIWCFFRHLHPVKFKIDYRYIDIHVTQKDGISNFKGQGSEVHPPLCEIYGTKNRSGGWNLRYLQFQQPNGDHSCYFSKGTSVPCGSGSKVGGPWFLPVPTWVTQLPNYKLGGGFKYFLPESSKLWYLSPLTTKNRPRGWNLTPLEGPGMFIPIWGRWPHFDKHIFQRGWFNHQLVRQFIGAPCPCKPWDLGDVETHDEKDQATTAVSGHTDTCQGGLGIYW